MAIAHVYRMKFKNRCVYCWQMWKTSHANQVTSTITWWPMTSPPMRWYAAIWRRWWTGTTPLQAVRKRWRLQRMVTELIGCCYWWPRRCTASSAALEQSATPSLLPSSFSIVPCAPQSPISTSSISLLPISAFWPDCHYSLLLYYVRYGIVIKYFSIPCPESGPPAHGVKFVKFQSIFTVFSSQESGLDRIRITFTTIPYSLSLEIKCSNLLQIATDTT